ncbi:MAG: HtaA domain-containing protein [Mycetocola sp.]
MPDGNSAELTWSVKDSLLSYIETLDDGKVEAEAPATRTEGAFRFPGDAGTFDWIRGAGTLTFLGAVRLTGHWGALDIELRDPKLELAGKGGTLLVRERGGRDPAKFLPFADLVLESQMTGAGSGHFEATASLTGQGQILLGGQYRVGEVLSALRVDYRHGDE